MNLTNNLKEALHKLEYLIPKEQLGRFDQPYLIKLEGRLKGFASLFPASNLANFSQVNYSHSLEDRIVSHIDNLTSQIKFLIKTKKATQASIQKLFAQRPTTVREEFKKTIREPGFITGLFAWSAMTTILACFFSLTTAIICPIVGAFLIFGIIACKLAAVSFEFDQWKKNQFDPIITPRFLEDLSSSFNGSETESPSSSTRSLSSHSISSNED